MIRTSQLRGALLEEIALWFLAANGYATVDIPGTDPTLQIGGAGLEVKGRGAQHQIDAIADCKFSPPFIHPIRLLVEAKSQKRKVGIDVVRNAYGTVSDVGQFWIGSQPTRYSYQYAIFADTEFSTRAQEFAFAHNIYLFPLQRAQFLAPVLSALRRVNVSPTESRSIGQIRRRFRQLIRHPVVEAADEVLLELAETISNAGSGVVAVTPVGLPIFLVPSPNTDVAQMPDEVSVRISWSDESWFIRSLGDRWVFSFDLPSVLFEKYSEFGILDGESALRLKENELSRLSAWLSVAGRQRRIVFHLDADWIERVRAVLATKPEAR